MVALWLRGRQPWKLSPVRRELRICTECRENAPSAVSGDQPLALAMQKVEGSSPFSRFLRRSAVRAFVIPGRRLGRDARADNRLGPIRVRFQRLSTCPQTYLGRAKWPTGTPPPTRTAA